MEEFREREGYFQLIDHVKEMRILGENDPLFMRYVGKIYSSDIEIYFKFESSHNKQNSGSK